MNSNGLRILREVEGLPDYILANIVADRDLIEFDDGTTWVDNDNPWDAVIGREIVKHTKGFIVADAKGGRLAGPYRDLKKTEAVRASAKVQVVSVVEDIELDEAELLDR